ncbi:hypothetical protein KKE26_08495 [bacterium]|nr:hypothetical protein [bacterium]MBU1754028.1 hypothetical protein [bacterium]
MEEYEEYHRAEKQAMERTMELLSKGLSREPKEELDYAGIAAYLHNLYSGVENILKHTLKHSGIRIAQSETWHKELLMAAVTQGIISELLVEQLKSYLKFRHFFIHGYGFMLDAELLIPLAEKANHVFCQFFKELRLYNEGN